VHRPPYSGTTRWGDGYGAHTWIARDLHDQINNLGAYCARDVAFIMSPRAAGWVSAETPWGAVERLIHTSSREIYMSQCPIRINKTAKRLLWTAGIEGRNVAGAGVCSITAATVYLSGRPYLGTSGDASTAPAFDTSLLLADDVAGARSDSLSISTTTKQYELATDTTTGFIPPMPLSSIFNGSDTDNPWCYAILTVTAVAGGGQRFARCFDFSIWPEYV
jgi:hypothetical protein